MRNRVLLACLLSAGLAFSVPAVAMAEDVVIDEAQTETNFTLSDVNAENKIVVRGDVTLNGEGNAFTINADTELVFEDGASLTLTGYNNGFVVSDATLSGGGWNITDGDGMDLLRLQENGKLAISDDVTLEGFGTDAAAASRAIVLESGSGQAVSLAADKTLAANGFYRGMETGGASNYTISGQDMETSIFDFSGNDCGIAISYFDASAAYQNCKLEVSNCLTSGIFMRQDNAALDGLLIDNVWINCKNGPDLDQADIAIRFHSNNFTIQNSKIYIENAWNTGLWICDGWNENEQNEIKNTQIMVNHVENKDSLASLLGASHRKGITFVPYRNWLVSGSTITLTDTGDGGINVASDPQVKKNGSILPSAWTATLGMRGGKVIFQDTEITTSGITGADLGAQVGQWIEIGKNTVINNGNADDHYTILCDVASTGYPVDSFFGTTYVPYEENILTEDDNNPNRVIVTGGSYWSTQRTDIVQGNVNLYDYSIPSLGEEKLHMVTVTPEEYAIYAVDGVLTVIKSDGSTYTYEAKTPSSDGNRYIWIPNGATLKGSVG